MTDIIDTSFAPEFKGREDYLAWRAQWRIDYAALTASIRAAKQARHQPLPEPSVRARRNDTRAQARRRLQAARLLRSIEQSDLAGLRLDAAIMMMVRLAATEQARAAYAAHKAARQAAQSLAGEAA